MKRIIRIWLYICPRLKKKGGNIRIADHQIELPANSEVVQKLMQSPGATTDILGMPCTRIAYSKDEVIVMADLPDSDTIEKIQQLEEQGVSFLKNTCMNQYGLVW